MLTHDISACSATCAMLNDLMKNGLKIDGRDRLGKTIIFASSHLEAEKIVERFQNLYPYLGLDYCKLIDSQVADNLSLIDSFGERDQLPQIAVSVDMMDTGIDVPALHRSLCPEWNASPAPGTGSVHAQSRYQCLLSHVITDGTVT